MNNEQLWQAVLGEIELMVSKANFTTWFKHTFISTYDNGHAVICVPNIFTKAWLEKKYQTEIITALKNTTKEEKIEIIFKIDTKRPIPSTKTDKGQEKKPEVKFSPR